MFGLLIFFVLLLAIIRIFCLINAAEWLTFPEDCEDHPDGCYRVDANESGYKVDTIINERYNTSYTYEGTHDVMAYFNVYMSTCLDREYQSKILSNTTFIHADFASLTFGFVDDTAIRVISMFNCLDE